MQSATGSSPAPAHDGASCAPPAQGEPYLLTPGPLTTALSTKEAMLRDWGSWDGDFRAMTAQLRSSLLDIAGNEAGEYDCVPLQGSGTYCVEAMLGSLVPRDGHALVLANGAYGKRIATTLGYLGRAQTVLDKGDYLPPRAAEVERMLDADPSITHVVAVHCETSSGILNPIEEIAEVAAAKGRKLLIDSMSAFGALPLDVRDIACEAFVSSANKCIEGVPGFGFVIARKRALHDARGRSHSLALDVHDQWDVMNRTGQWRFTPPTHAVAAFMEALRLYRQEGGQPARLARYANNRDVLVAGMRELGFEPLLSARWRSPIIVTFFSPAHPSFSFERFYELMKEQGFIIYPGKLTVVESFRIGCIGRVDEHVMRRVVNACASSLQAMGVDHAAPSTAAIEERKLLGEAA
ncbi:2-aminoethylphosphonate--pyruvate transaminase [Paraburkholderia phenoliruptrix]|uniref:2-aminoethylphosphonate--pyruvate transaminase n=2 Tax=Paraburkholderia phenoliruptrix TaxID=252970 RepID=K0DHY1_9BURK|nr:2-aminoethylphosphonate--pyruvate transaminase [Paraburkholderia phenoliruptrix]AFT85656.1 2-aminoethylphosphonate-pyruvate transaminase [Paraburkholderia phenoliruptrix BR3459a]MDR6421760.1 2-aminoethylphosphonate-pyruvate transaminase [Paraburkholderia phenoliruptrix]CAB4048174.1 2-aminoethylphosphonate--pyruvate transaminase [Paraburkholderia phenoliruptrix]